MRCPVCKAENVQPPQCRRCKTDLSLLFALKEQRRRMLAEARRCLRRGEWEEAMRHAETADGLHGDEESRRLAALACLLGGDFSGAWQAYQHWRETKRNSREMTKD